MGDFLCPAKRSGRIQGRLKKKIKLKRNKIKEVKYGFYDKGTQEK